MSKKTKKDLYKDLIDSVINGNQIVEYGEKKVFDNFCDKLEKDMYLVDYYDPELMVNQILSHIHNNDPNRIKDDLDNDLTSLQNEIRENFLRNKDIHFLICPLQCSVITEDIVFNNMFFLKKRETDEEFYKAISDCTNLNEEKIKDFLMHTQKSRSKDFLNDNILIFKIENQTDLIKRTAYSIIQDVFNYLRVIYYAVEAQTNFLDEMREHFREENRHVAILSNDDWRKGHGNSFNSNLQIQLNLDFIKDTKNQKLINQMLKKLTFNKERDTLYYLFYNAIVLFNRALIYENSDIEVSNLLLLITGESLLTKNQNEKRLRLSVILPRLVELSKMSHIEVARMVNEQYHDRNDFVHGGAPSHNNSVDKELKQLFAKLIAFNFDFDEQDISEGKKVRENKWFDYINNIFDNAIFG